MTPDITISPQSKNEILSGKSLLDLIKDRKNAPSAIQLEGDPHFKMERENISIIYDSPEWGSEISSVPFLEQVGDEETECDFAHRKNTLDEVERKTFFRQENINKKGENLTSNKNEATKPLKIKTRPEEEQTNNIVNLKKYLLSKENPGNKTNNKQNNTNILKKGSRKTSPIILNRKTNLEEAVKSNVFTYNPFAEVKSPQQKSNLIIDKKQDSETVKDSISQSIKEKDFDSNTFEDKPRLRRKTNRVSFHAKNLKNVSFNKSAFSSTAEKEESKKNSISILTFFNVIRLVKKLLRSRYFKNRKEVYSFDPKEDPPVRRVMRRNKELIKRRNTFEQQDKKFEQRVQSKLIEESGIDFFDFTGYFSYFHPKFSARVPANATHPSLGKIAKAGFVTKVTNKSKAHHQRWLILRSFHLYWYTNPSVYLPQGVIPLPTLPLQNFHLKNPPNDCILVQQPKGRDLIIFYDDEWKEVLSNEMAHKRYVELVWEKERKADIAVIDYFEDEDCKTLNLSNEKINDPILYKFIYDSFRYHPKLKELNLAKCQIKERLLQDLFKSLKSLKKSTKLEALNLDSNGITKEMINDILDYLESEISFSLKKFSLNFNPIGDTGVQALLESMLTRFEKMNAEKKKLISLPFTELGLSGTRMADQSVFTLTAVFQEISRVLGEKGFEDHKELMKLEMAFNMISDNGMNALSKSLTTFHGIRELDLSSNLRLTGACFDTLMINLRKNASLEKLDYRKNALNLKGMENLFSNLADNFLLKRINVTINYKLTEAFVETKDMIMDFYKVALENPEQVNK